jgi:hypothetical protein
MKSFHEQLFVMWSLIALGLSGTTSVALAAELPSGDEILFRITEPARAFE